MFSDIMPFPTCANAQGVDYAAPVSSSQLPAPLKYELRQRLRCAAKPFRHPIETSNSAIQLQS